MPLYTAYCDQCHKERDYYSDCEHRDAALAELGDCCGQPMRRAIGMPSAGGRAATKCVDYSQINAKRGRGKMKGIYTDLGPKYAAPVRSKADMQKIVDRYNKDNPEERVRLRFND